MERGSDPGTFGRSQYAIILGLILLQAVAVFAFWVWQLPQPARVEVVEVHVLTLVRWFGQGHLPYTYPTAVPLFNNPYGPVYPWLSALLPEAGYLPGRALSIVAILSALGLVALAVYRRSGRVSLALLCFLLPLTSRPILLFAPLYRVDSLGVLFSVAGFLSVTRIRSSWGTPAGALLFLLAFATKMTLVAAPLAALLVLLGEDRRRALMLFGLLVTLPLFVAVMELLTGGGYLASAAMGNQPTDFAKPFDMAFRPVYSLFWLVALSVVWRGRKARLDDVTRATAIYVLVSLMVAAGFAINPATSWNSLMEFYVALALLTGDLLRNFRFRPEGRKLVGYALITHAVVSSVIAGLLVRDLVAATQAYVPKLEAVQQCLNPLMQEGARVAVIGLQSPSSRMAHDVVNLRPALNAIHLPEETAREPWIEEILLAARSNGALDLILRPETVDGCMAG